MEGKETRQNESVEEKIPTSPFLKYGKEIPKEIFSFQQLEFSRGR